ncbi:hypothetical protein BGZ65_005092 [Modicella reniformis]|uniref:Uncharacterized protein n=1 Tax=Modicella reniformis TaxID=1440133 RepID=A0A9P6LXW6_9FUNG|nr:hypothetical protein BGZ65_005092 [Modicella reniformis]
MDIKIVSAITRLANYMPLGSYVIYTALETYSFSLGAMPTPIKTIVQTPAANYTCYYIPGQSFTYTTCTNDQSNALKISLAIGFFLAIFLSFLKQVPANGTPPLPEDEDENDEEVTPVAGATESGAVSKKAKTKKKQKKTYVEGNPYYLDFGDHHIWGHALLSFVAFGTLSLFSASVSQCLFPTVRPWNFVFTQVVLLVVCCFIAMFWVDDPTLSIGLMVVPRTDAGPGGKASTPNLAPTAPSTSAPDAPMTIMNASTSTTTLPLNSVLARMYDPSATAAGLANVALANTVMNSAMNMSSLSGLSNTTAVGGLGGVGGGAVSRMTMFTRRTSTISSVNEKQDLELDQDQDQDLNPNIDHEYSSGTRDPEKVHATTDIYEARATVVSALSSSSSTSANESSHLSLKME